MSSPAAAQTNEHAAQRAPAAAFPVRQRRTWRLPRLAIGLLLPGAALLALELAVRTGLIPSHLLPAPSQIFDTLAELGAHGLLGHIGASTLRVAAGFGIGAALPSILTGLRNGLSLAWMFMVAAELIAASRGLGYLLSDGRETSRADIVLAAIALLAILGKASDSLMAALEHRLLSWRDNYTGSERP